MSLKIPLLLVALPMLGAFQQPTKLECPQPQPVTTSSTLRETAADIKGLQQNLARGTQGNMVDEIIFDLRKKYPKATNAEISNYLITAYCPIVASQHRPLEEAKSIIERFNSQVIQTLSK